MAIAPLSQKKEGKEDDLKYIRVSYMYSKGKGAQDFVAGIWRETAVTQLPADCWSLYLHYY